MKDELIIRAADSFPTPFYLFDTDALQDRVKKITELLEGRASLCFAMKANPFLLRSLRNLVDRFEICSPGEYHIFEKCDMYDQGMIYSGVYKDRKTLWEALEKHAHDSLFTVESERHLRYLDEWTAENKKKVQILLRLTSGNQFGMDEFDLEDAYGEQKGFMCSADLKEFVEKNHLNLSQDGSFIPRDIFGSHDDSDHVYNTPRAWYMLRTLNPQTFTWDGPDADYTPLSDDLPWCLIPEKKITVEDVKYVLSSHYQGTPYDPYLSYGDKSMKGAYRSIGVNRTDFLSVIQMRADHEDDSRAIEWVAFCSNAFNTLLPFYADVEKTPDYVANTDKNVSTDNFYWTSRLIAAMADASYKSSLFHVERYQGHVMAKSHALIAKYDAKLAQTADKAERLVIKHEANEAIAQMAKEEALATLEKVLSELTNQMKNAYSRSDA